TAKTHNRNHRISSHSHTANSGNFSFKLLKFLQHQRRYKINPLSTKKSLFNINIKVTFFTRGQNNFFFLIGFLTKNFDKSFFNQNNFLYFFRYLLKKVLISSNAKSLSISL